MTSATDTTANDQEIISPLAAAVKKDTIVNSSRSKVETVEVTNEYVLNFAFVSFVLFTFLQFIFALTARSQSMLTDCAAMTVDCASYLINYSAERLKSRHTPRYDERTGEKLSVSERQYKKKMRLLLLELAPPLLSVSTLVAVTVIAIDQALTTLLDTDPNDKGPAPDLFLMLLFSSLNFVLDGVNVLCFARADKKNGFIEGLTAAVHPKEHCEKSKAEHERRGSMDNSAFQHNNTLPVTTEKTHLLSGPLVKDSITLGMESDEDDNLSEASQSSRGLNLNMCSAWTHVCADTLRSIAVLTAAGFAWLFPSILTPADADSYGAIVVSVIIIISLGPLFEGLYFTALEIYYLYIERQQRLGATTGEDPVVSLAV